jgi:ABC-type Fe3+/spermidine/putrescine transport system ATPase subunit
MALRAERLTKVFTDSGGASITAVDDVNLEVAAGEFVSLLGPSGCGKTTLLRMIAGFETPTSGDLYLDGRPVTHLPPNARGTAMVFQSYALFPHLTVFENVAFGLRVRETRQEEVARRVGDALGIVGLSGLEQRSPDQLSGGQQQRVAVARAIVGKPLILLADEPTGNLDSKNGQAVMDLLKELHDEGATICMVTHDPRYAHLAERTVHLFDGQIVNEEDARKARELEQSGFDVS